MSRSNQFINISLYPKKASAETISGQWLFDHASDDTVSAIFNIDDNTGFSKAFQGRVNGVTKLEWGSTFGLAGFANPANDFFFFGLGSALDYFLQNGAAHVSQIVCNGSNYDFDENSLNAGAKNFLTTGVLSNGSVPIDSAHDHTGVANNGNVIPHLVNLPGNSIGTIYHNTQPRPIIVSGSITCTAGASGGQCSIDCKIGPSSPPTQSVGVAGPLDKPSALSIWGFNFFFIVPAGYFYTIAKTEKLGGTVTLNQWLETPF